jgi:hypothetical protein
VTYGPHEVCRVCGQRAGDRGPHTVPGAHQLDPAVTELWQKYNPADYDQTETDGPVHLFQPRSPFTLDRSTLDGPDVLG